MADGEVDGDGGICTRYRIRLRNTGAWIFRKCFRQNLHLLPSRQYMDAASYLRRQGWQGEGHSLSHTGNGLKKPLLISKKIDVLGVGLNKHAAVSDQWWMRAFDQGLKDLGTGKKTTLSTVREKGVHFGGLYGRFVKGDTVQGTIEEEEEKMAGKKRKGDDGEETKKRKRADEEETDLVKGQTEKAPKLEQKSIDRDAEALIAKAVDKGLILADSELKWSNSFLKSYSKAVLQKILATAASNRKAERSTLKKLRAMQDEYEEDKLHRALKRAAKEYILNQLSPDEREEIEGETVSRPDEAGSARDTDTAERDDDKAARKEAKAAEKEAKEAEKAAMAANNEVKETEKEVNAAKKEAKAAKKEAKEAKRVAEEAEEKETKREAKESKKQERKSKREADSEDTDLSIKPLENGYNESSTNTVEDVKSDGSKRQKKQKSGAEKVENHLTESEKSASPGASEPSSPSSAADYTPFPSESFADANANDKKCRKQPKPTEINVIDADGQIRHTFQRDEPIPSDPSIWIGIRPRDLPRPVRAARRNYMKDKREARKARQGPKKEVISKGAKKMEIRKNFTLSILKESRKAIGSGESGSFVTVGDVKNVPLVKVGSRMGAFSAEEMRNARRVAGRVIKAEKKEKKGGNKRGNKKYKKA